MDEGESGWVGMRVRFRPISVDTCYLLLCNLNHYYLVVVVSTTIPTLGSRHVYKANTPLHHGSKF